MEIRGRVILVRTVNSKKITYDTTLTSLAERLGMSYESLRYRKYPFDFEKDGETYHFSRLEPKDVIRETKMEDDSFSPVAIS